MGGFDVRLVDFLVFGLGVLGYFTRAKYRAKAGSYFAALAVSMLYLGLSALLGLQNDVGLGAIFVQARFIIYLLLLTTLVGKVTGADLLAVGSATLKIVSIPLLAISVMSVAGIPPVTLSAFPGSSLGTIAGDLGTIVGVLAICSVCEAAMKGHLSWSLLWLLLPVLGNQRAAILTTTLLGIACMIFVWWRFQLIGARSRNRLELAAVFGGMLGSLAVGIALLNPSSFGIISQTIDGLTTVFTSEGKQASAATRPFQLNLAWEGFKEQPLVGHGLGKGVYFYDIYNKELVTTGSAHNFIADIALRGGLVGIILATILFIVAVGIRYQWTVPRLAFCAALMTLMAKAALEPAFDKFRLVFLIAFCVSAMVVSRTSIGSDTSTKRSQNVPISDARSAKAYGADRLVAKPAAPARSYIKEDIR
ncbi:O-antigen ligase family protein [Arthrobacter crystallopoietes]|uniref:O-antigen ligase family protein n=1 Tax=Crystallibacter crystallopoietes TaxID=37928 RepID=UPI003D19D756